MSAFLLILLLVINSVIGIDISCITNSRDLKCYALECHGLFDFLTYDLCCTETSGPDHSCGRSSDIK